MRASKEIGNAKKGKGIDAPQRHRQQAQALNSKMSSKRTWPRFERKENYANPRDLTVKKAEEEHV